ncbi:maleylpyruvate isomerase N-terminal domain-containing protein [Blastococcus mobilis]|uniref:Maleylpyruvate isomerase n=1 Tax=Blastococcus mobilis TaxID=1938746 RepID=A0A238VBW6_9ACTN|nr:maleylpyruvate isomerase N-terminal domain-containing protein [Blastococcus mobilis]SNR31019.1 maleylpyruvate isomerase [Blastococcus mobilis]
MSHTPSPEQALRWWADGELIASRMVHRLTDAELAADSALPDWSRAHVVAHLARNADALVNLLTWARTGVETPMYPSRAARDAGIEATAALPAAELRSDYAAASDRLTTAVESMPAEAWTATVRNGQGAAVPASAVPWMRTKEVWVHGVDLRSDLAFADVPADVCTALVDDVLGLFAARDQAPEVTVVATDVDRTWGNGGTRVEGPVTAVAAWLTRSDASGLSGDVPPPPTWL